MEELKKRIPNVYLYICLCLCICVYAHVCLHTHAYKYSHNIQYTYGNRYWCTEYSYSGTHMCWGQSPVDICSSFGNVSEWGIILAFIRKKRTAWNKVSKDGARKRRFTGLGGLDNVYHAERGMSLLTLKQKNKYKNRTFFFSFSRALTREAVKEKLSHQKFTVVPGN